MSLSLQNPWLTIWTRPRQTIEHVIHKNVNQYLFWLSCIYGIPLAVRIAQSFFINSATVWPFLATALALAPLVGFVGIEITAGLLYWTGSWLGLSSSFKKVRAAVGWSNLPSLIILPIWGLYFALFGSSIFLGTFDYSHISLANAWILFGSTIVNFAFTIWCIILLVQTISAVHKTTRLRALCNWALAVLLFLLLFFILNWCCSSVTIVEMQATN